jgi:hypothetical protein
MKRLMIIMVAVLFSTVLFAQKMTEIKESELPKAVTDYLKVNMPGASVFKAVKADDKGTITYNVAVDTKGRKHILVFDKSGNFLKKGDNLSQEQKAAAAAALDPKNAAKTPATEQAPKK